MFDKTFSSYFFINKYLFDGMQDISPLNIFSPKT